MENDGGEWVTLYRSATERSCRERSFMLQAIGIPHIIRPQEGDFELLVPAAEAKRGRAELDDYEAEDRVRPTLRLAIRRPANGWIGVTVYVGVLVLAAVLAEQKAFGLDWFVVGRTHASRIRHGEWWRTVTALTLHADLLHGVGNLVIGGLVGLFAGKSFGSGIAWFGILLAGAMGNFLNAWVRPPDHMSVGASTAVFAALGLLAGHAWRKRQWLSASWMERWAPLIGGVVLLSFLGTGGGRTDVAAHVLGFVCGALFGVLLGRRGEESFLSRRAQWLFGSAASAMVVIAWALALSK